MDEYWNEYNIGQKCQCVMVVLAAVLKVTKQQLDTKGFSGLKLAKVCQEIFIRSTIKVVISVKKLHCNHCNGLLLIQLFT